MNRNGTLVNRQMTFSMCQSVFVQIIQIFAWPVIIIVCGGLRKKERIIIATSSKVINVLVPNSKLH